MKDPNTIEKSIDQCTVTVAEDLSVCYTLYGTKAETGTAYSVKATVTQTGESAVAHDITRIESKAHHMFGMICRGGVTPCCLHEIAEDLIEAAFSDIPEDGRPL